MVPPEHRKIELARHVSNVILFRKSSMGQRACPIQQPQEVMPDITIRVVPRRFPSFVPDAGGIFI
jgi:hypothetical protein